LNLTNTPLYRFLAKFPLKQSPAPHHRPRPVRPVLYAFVPGWKIAKKETTTESEAAAAATEGEADNKKGAQDETPVGSFDVDSLKWMVWFLHFLYLLPIYVLTMQQQTPPSPSCR
jgi:hypothetical protein